MKSFEEHLRGAKAHNREDKIWLVTCFSGKMATFLTSSQGMSAISVCHRHRGLAVG